MNQENKKPIYLIPGWGFYAEILQCPAFCNFNCINVDYFNKVDASIHEITAYLNNLISDSATVVGWSLGGLFAIKLASMYPKKVKKLILIGSQPRFLEDASWSGISVPTSSRFICNADTDFSKLQGRFIQLVNYPSREQSYKKILLEHQINDSKEKLLELLTLMFEVDLRTEYQNLKTKILHIINNNDAVIKQNEQMLKRLNPNIQVFTLENAGHAGFLTHRNEYQSIVNEFAS